MIRFQFQEKDQVIHTYCFEHSPSNIQASKYIAPEYLLARATLATRKPIKEELASFSSLISIKLTE